VTASGMTEAAGVAPPRHRPGALGDWRREAALWLRSTSAVASVALLAALATVAVALGLGEVARQHAAIERVLDLQASEEAAIAGFAEDAGSAAYYTAHATWDSPSPLAFAALGQRDAAPWVLRVRALALEGQLYESDAQNPELALPGRFDLAFVLVYLAPLVLVALLHDLKSAEREAGRLGLLLSMPGATRRLWVARAGVRAIAVLLALAVPFGFGAALAGAGLLETLGGLGVMVGTVAFWTLLAVLIALRGRRSAVNAAILCAAWFALVLVGPAAGHLAVNAAVPIPSGAELARENREAVHGAWDRPRAETMARFVSSHPEWAPYAAIDRPFHWKWYFAFQQLGDEHVAERSRAYRDGIERRERLAGAIGWVLPPIGLQRALHRLARTDVAAQLEYQERIRAFHAELRAFYWPYVFREQPFGPADFARTPRFASVR